MSKTQSLHFLNFVKVLVPSGFHEKTKQDSFFLVLWLSSITVIKCF